MRVRDHNDSESTVPQVRAPVLGANLGDTLPRFERGVSSSHATRSAAHSGLRRIPFCNLQLHSDSGPVLICSDSLCELRGHSVCPSRVKVFY